VILPASTEAERYILGSIQISECMGDWRGVLVDQDWSLESHRRIWRAACELYDTGSHIDRVTLAQTIIDRGELESVGGISYLVSLDDGLPEIVNLSAYVQILKDKAALRRIIAVGYRMTERAQLGGMEPQAVIDEARASIAELEPVESGRDPLSVAELIERDGLGKLLAPRRPQGDIVLPWNHLDRILAGLQPTQMITIAGHTSEGKTSLALQIAAHAAKKTGVIVFTLEMSKRQMFRRMVSQISGVSSNRMRGMSEDGAHKDALTQDELTALREAAAELNGTQLWFDEQSRTIPAIHSSIRKVRGKREVGLVVVDYLQKLASGERVINRAQEVAGFSRAMKTAAMEFQCPFVVLSQFARLSKKEDRDPELHDLKESGEIENDSDVVLLIRKGRHDDGSLVDQADPDIRPRDIYIAKQREGVRDVRVPMLFFAKFQRFEEAG